MSNIYLKVTIEKNWRSQNFDFLSLKNLSSSQFLGISNSHRYHWILNLLVGTCLGAKLCVAYFNFEKNYGVLKCEMISYELRIAILRKLIYELQVNFYELQF